MKRFIRYLYEYEGNQKKRNVGFVKVEQDGKETTISVHGKGLCGKSNENISCYLIKLDSETGNILFVPAGEIQIGMISCGGCFCYTEELIRAGYGKTEQSVGQTCEKKDDICGLGLGDPKEAFYVALWNEEMYGDLDIARAKVFQEFDSDKTAGESKSIDEKEAEVETQFGDDEETENLEEEQPEKKEQETVEESSEKKEQETVEELPEKKEQEIVEESSEKKNLKKDDRDIDLQNFRRQIMKIQRGEISILPRCEWKLANNNFLLHGYYNYRHLVLIDEGNQLKLGVPGIYHEREARAAATFGFPEFIAEADVNVTLEPQERNENQQFGYWCRQVRRPPR
ncbi:hypothetical protein [Dorea formicigenerans]|uniref:Uncharacterized protein n=1 Tax=Dorea formicigenerans TaxID=39486 RepID=A0A3E5GQN5_9FIRM|nr:hypothetical protein [Dorea formicigenerans]RGO48284.1 hypothetical protein DXB12_12780 [Dorea formicigenerans]RGT10793.1 hypothetical protein DWX53_05090 [Dorea formicigenerans]RHE29062.1 hypothetical protein DW756_04885 [Dorea formicigenerans]